MLDGYLSQYITTNVRKKIWMNIDGLKFQNELVKISGISQPSVSELLEILKKAGLIQYEPRKPPIKQIDYTPISWLEI